MAQFRTGTVGPAPDGNALRRNRPGDAASWTRLPGRGLSEAPDWPAEATADPETPVTMAEQAYWTRIWLEYPQAHIWKRNRMEMQVAAYVRTAVFCASGYPKSTMLTVMRQQSQELLITPHALRAARCIIDEEIENVIEETTNEHGVAPVIQIAGGSVRDRMRSAAAAAPPEDPDEDEEDEEDMGDDEEGIDE
jgi:hypothetical protein